MAKKELKFAGLCRTPEYGADDHIAYIATVTPGLRRRIEAAQAALAGIEDGYCIEIWDYGIKVYSQVPSTKALVAADAEVVAEYETQCEDGVVFDSDRHGVQVDCPTLKVTKTGFLWCWYPRHSSNSGECSTAHFTVEQCRKLMEGFSTTADTRPAD